MKKASKSAVSNLITYGIVIAAYIICQVLIENGQMTRALKGQLVPICVYVVMAVSLNLTVGISGELSLGHAGFMSVGAFAGTIASAWVLAAFQLENEVIRLILAMVVGGAAAGVAGVLIGIPVLRLRGDYLAIVTLAFGDHPQRAQLPVYLPGRRPAAPGLSESQPARGADGQRAHRRNGH